MSYTTQDLIGCLERELTRRNDEYPLLITTGKMSYTDAEDEIAMIREVIALMRPEGESDNTLYNKCMGLYRAFHKKQLGLSPNLVGKTAKTSSDAMKAIIKYLMANIKSKSEEGVYNALEYIFNGWDSLSDFYKKQVALPDIQRNLSNILYELKNGANKQSAATIQANEHDRSLEERRRAASAGTHQ